MPKKKKKKRLDSVQLFPEIAHFKKRALLTAFVACGGIYRAARAIKSDVRIHYHWKKNDPVYLEAFERAKQMAGDYAEDEIYRRAFFGVDHPVTYEGQITATYKDYSDTLAIFYLKGLKPEKYRDNYKLELSGKDNGPIQHEVFDVEGYKSTFLEFFTALTEAHGKQHGAIPGNGNGSNGSIHSLSQGNGSR